MTTDEAGQARQGLLDSALGKAKEVAGAVTGNDHLAEQGQLQQAEAEARRAADRDEAIAEAQSREAADDLKDQQRAAAQQRHATYEQAGQKEQDIARAEAAEKAAADQQAAQVAQAGERQAEVHADAVAETSERESAGLVAQAEHTEQRAVQEAQRLEQEASDADRRAAELRAAAVTQEGTA